MNNASPVETLLFAALEKPTAAQRSAFLDSACADDAELRRIRPRTHKMRTAECRKKVRQRHHVREVHRRKLRPVAHMVGVKQIADPQRARRPGRDLAVGEVVAELA